ncbi:thiamine pyrophosphate-binding protein [Streptomyces sp. NBC_01381]|uniref:thiamine pyrophosphate-binding protein n=1 Tax=Streptomyces sp. NBC_01381 TaxID=2903845 RepID=UPI002252D1AB|nr:thiamine pyrophosphate-binding protein [Streptomyces sp. NBC_01381]MCX4668442.1 thiamine pyrophosphate-binding protein [Streptomyces sp. NBC_01381]
MHYATGGDLLVAVLRELGVDTVFGIVSVHNLPLVEAVDRELRFVPVRHEATAVNAADAYGRARGSLGCALTSTGTGAGNAAGSLVEALSSGTSVLHITGQVESEFLGSGRGFIHETKDQLGMLRAVSAYAASVPSANAAGRILREAARAALTDPGGPASVEWPVDLQYAAQTDVGGSADRGSAGAGPAGTAGAGPTDLAGPAGASPTGPAGTGPASPADAGPTSPASPADAGPTSPADPAGASPTSPADPAGASPTSPAGTSPARPADASPTSPAASADASPTSSAGTGPARPADASPTGPAASAGASPTDPAGTGPARPADAVPPRRPAGHVPASAPVRPEEEPAGAETLQATDPALATPARQETTGFPTPPGPTPAGDPAGISAPAHSPLPAPADRRSAAAPSPFAAPRPSRPLPAEGELAAAQALLASARRPLIWAGGGATRARRELAELLDATGAGLLTSNSGRGSVPEDHPQVIGNFATTPAARALLADADVLLTIGTHFRSNETADYGLELPAAHIQIDIDAAALGRVYPARHPLHGHAPDVLAALLPHARRAEESWTRRITEVREDVRATLHDNIGPQAAICDAIRAALPREAVVARDVTIPSSSWGNRLLEMYDPRDNVFPRGGGIGQGLGMGIGAALARTDAPTVVLAGDGGLAVHLGELLTLAQERPRLTLIVFNDGGYGVLRNMQDRYSERRSGVDLATPDFELLAQACGLAYARIAAEEHAEPVISHAVASEGPTLVEVDLARLGPMKNPFTPPVKIPGQ